MTLKETIANRVKKSNDLKDRIDSLNIEQCMLALRWLVNRTIDIDGSPSVIIINRETYLFNHIMVNVIELAEEL